MANELFSKYSPKDLIPKDFKIISVKDSALAPDVLKVLVDNKIHSVPVEKTSSTNNNNNNNNTTSASSGTSKSSDLYAGIIDLLDILVYICMMTQVKSIVDILNSEPVDWHSYLKRESEVFKEFDMKSLLEDKTQNERNPWCPVWHKVPLPSLLDMFSKDVNLHRVPIVDDDGKVIGFVSQSLVIHWLHEHSKEFESSLHLERKIGDISFTTPHPKVLTCNLKDSALDGFSKLVNENVMGLAVVDDNGILKGCLSASDIKRSASDQIFKNMNISVNDYLTKLNPSFGKPIFSCTTKDTLKTVLETLAINKIHRVFVVDDQNKPIRVLSLCDLISSLFS